MALFGLAAALLAGWNAQREMAARRQAAIRSLHTRITVCGTRMHADLWSACYVIGRRRRRCDLDLSGADRGGTVSKVHAVLRRTSSGFRIFPVYDRKKHRYTEVYVNAAAVSPKGCEVRYYDQIRLGSLTLMLSDTR